MSEYRAQVRWQRETPTFSYETYNRGHTLEFEGGIRVSARAAPGGIPKTAPAAIGIDPEQGFVASLASCHMLWFLHLACRAGYTVDAYADDASGVLGKNAAGKIAMTQVTLRPAVKFAGRAPDPAEHEELHHQAHERCYIANSVTSEVRVEPSIA